MKQYSVSSIFDASKPKEGKDIRDSLRYAKLICLVKRHKYNMLYFSCFDKLFNQNEYIDEKYSFYRIITNNYC